MRTYSGATRPDSNSTEASVDDSGSKDLGGVRIVAIASAATGCQSLPFAYLKVRTWKHRQINCDCLWSVRVSARGPLPDQPMPLRFDIRMKSKRQALTP